MLGANSLNIGLILGLTAIVRPLHAQLQLIRFDVPIMILATLVAAGTTLPELITCLVAVVRRESDIAVGNIVGSNIFNLLGVLGLAAVFAPIGTAGMQLTELWGAVALAALSLPVMWRGLIVNRVEGTLLIAAYLVYLVLVWRG